MPRNVMRISSSASGSPGQQVGSFSNRLFFWSGAFLLIQCPAAAARGLLLLKPPTPAAPAAAAPAPGLNAVGAVSARPLEAATRVEIKTASRAEFAVVDSGDPAKVIIEIAGATIAEKDRKTLDLATLNRELARLLQPWGCTLLAAKRDVRHPEDTGFTPEGLGDPAGDMALRLYPIQALKSMLKECDFVLVCVPLTPETRGLIGVKELAVLKPSAFIVDLSRGGVIDQEALVNALRENKLGGAALDVFAQEPLPPDSEMWDLPNLLVTPHMAGNFSAYLDRVMDILLVSTPYDTFILDEAGELSERMLGEFRNLDLHYAPGLTGISSGEEALRLAREQSRVNLIVTTPMSNSQASTRCCAQPCEVVSSTAWVRPAATICAR